MKKITIELDMDLLLFPVGGDLQTHYNFIKGLFERSEIAEDIFFTFIASSSYREYNEEVASLIIYLNRELLSLLRDIGLKYFSSQLDSHNFEISELLCEYVSDVYDFIKICELLNDEFETFTESLCGEYLNSNGHYQLNSLKSFFYHILKETHSACQSESNRTSISS